MQETHKVSATIVKGQTHWFLALPLQLACCVSLLCVSRSALNLMLFDSTAQPATPVCPDSPSYAGISVSPHDRHQQSHHMSLCFYNSMFFGGCSLFLRNSHTGQR